MTAFSALGLPQVCDGTHMCRPLHFYHKVTVRASVPQNTLWETLLGGCQGKAGRGREDPGKETATLLEKQVCALQTGDNRDGICPFSRDIEQAQPPIKLCTSDRAPLLEPTVSVLVQGLPHRPARPSSTEPSLAVPPQFSSVATADSHEPRSQSDSNWLTIDFRG